jgi:hypothetical protein
MKHRFAWLVGPSALLLVVAAIWLRHATVEVTERGGKDQPQLAARMPRKPQVTAPQPARAQPVQPAPVSDSAKLANQSAILATIEDAAVTYDAKALPAIEPYLVDPDPVVRAAALNGMIVLGDAAAAPLLREASRHVDTPQEAVALLEAAKFVELPSANLSITKGFGRGSRGARTHSFQRHIGAPAATVNPETPATTVAPVAPPAQ